MFTKRFSGVRAIPLKEFQIQIQLVNELKYRLRKGVLYWYTPNEVAKDDPKLAAKLKAMGMLPGMTDLIFMWSTSIVGAKVVLPTIFPRLLFLELKAGKNEPTTEQLNVRDIVRAMGASWEWASSVKEAIVKLEKYDLLKPEGSFK